MHFAVVAFGDVKYLVQYVLSDCAEVSVDIGKYELGHGIGKLQFLHTPSWKHVDNLVSLSPSCFMVVQFSALYRPFI